MLKSLRAGDWVVLLLVVLGVGSTAHYVGITNPTVIAMLSIGWTCPAARQLVAWRRGDAPMRRISPDDLATMPVLLFGAAPWAILPLMQALNPSSPLLSIPVLPAVRLLGAVLIVIGILRPLWTRATQTLRPTPGANADHLFDGSTSVFEAIGLLLLMGSAFFAVLAFGVWVTAPLARRLTTERAEPAVFGTARDWLLGRG